jgi:hypothetical protein
MGMQIYVYLSKKDADIMAFTLDVTGRNLPESDGPWVLGDNPDVLDAGAGLGPVSAFIQQDGYFIAVKQTYY